MTTSTSSKSASSRSTELSDPVEGRTFSEVTSLKTSLLIGRDLGAGESLLFPELDLLLATLETIVGFVFAEDGLGEATLFTKMVLIGTNLFAGVVWAGIVTSDELFGTWNVFIKFGLGLIEVLVALGFGFSIIGSLAGFGVLKISSSSEMFNGSSSSPAGISEGTKIVGTER